MSDEVRIESEMMERITRLAESSGRSVSDIVNDLLEDALESIEDYEACVAACEAYDRDPVSHSLDESRRRLGL